MKITILNAPQNQPNEFPIEKSMIAIGADKEWADVSWPWDGSLSRQHARLCYEGEAYWLEDLSSWNATFIDEKKITGKTQLKAGDEFRLGKTLLRLEDDGGPPPNTRFVQTTSESMAVSMPPSGFKEIAEYEPQPKVENPIESARVKLIVLRGNHFVEHSFEKSSITIGREEKRGNDLAVWDPRVSNPHAQLVLQDGRWHVVDLNSRNGTFLQDRTRLQPEMRVRFPIGSTFTIANLFDFKLVHGILGSFDKPGVAFIQTEFRLHLAAEALFAQLWKVKDPVKLLKQRLAFSRWNNIILRVYQLCATRYNAQDDFVGWLRNVLSTAAGDTRINTQYVLRCIEGIPQRRRNAAGYHHRLLWVCKRRRQ